MPPEVRAFTTADHMGSKLSSVGSSLGEGVVELGIAALLEGIGQQLAIDTDVVIWVLADVNHGSPIVVANRRAECLGQAPHNALLYGPLQSRAVEHRVQIRSRIPLSADGATAGRGTVLVLAKENAEDLCWEGRGF